MQPFSQNNFTSKTPTFNDVLPFLSPPNLKDFVEIQENVKKFLVHIEAPSVTQYTRESQLYYAIKLRKITTVNQPIGSHPNRIMIILQNSNGFMDSSTAASSDFLSGLVKPFPVHPLHQLPNFTWIYFKDGSFHPILLINFFYKLPSLSVEDGQDYKTFMAKHFPVSCCELPEASQQQYMKESYLLGEDLFTMTPQSPAQGSNDESSSSSSSTASPISTPPPLLLASNYFNTMSQPLHMANQSFLVRAALSLHDPSHWNHSIRSTRSAQSARSQLREGPRARKEKSTHKSKARKFLKAYYPERICEGLSPQAKSRNLTDGIHMFEDIARMTQTLNETAQREKEQKERLERFRTVEEKKAELIAECEKYYGHCIVSGPSLIPFGYFF